MCSCRIYIQICSGFPRAYFWKTAASDCGLVKGSGCVWSAVGAGYSERPPRSPPAGPLNRAAVPEAHAPGGGVVTASTWGELKWGILKTKGEEGVLVPSPLTFFISLRTLRVNTNACYSHACYLCQSAASTWPSSYAVCFKEANFLVILLVQSRWFVSEIQSSGFVASIVV